MLSLTSFSKPKLAQEPGDGRDVEIVLVLGRLLRLRLDQQHALEADLVLVVDDHRQEPAELLELALQVGVEQRLVALASAPQHVIRAMQLMRRVDRVLHLRRCVGEHVRVRVGRGARHVARMAEEVGRPPQELDAGRQHLLGESIGDLGEVAAELRQVCALGNDVLVVEAEEREAEGRKHLEGDVRLEPRAPHVLVVPGTLERGGAEHVRAQPTEVVPVADRRAKMLGHRLAEDDPARIVMPEGQRIFALRPFEFHRSDIAEEPFAHGLMLQMGFERSR